MSWIIMGRAGDLYLDPGSRAFVFRLVAWIRLLIPTLRVQLGPAHSV